MIKKQNFDQKIALFEGRKIRKTIFANEWWFSVVDVCGALSESVDAGAYWRKLKQRLTEEGSQVVTFCHGLKLIAADGKNYETDCANTEGIFRIIQSIPSPKAEPFKKWLARVGYERIKEIEDPELATKRAVMTYKLKGYDDAWIDKRLRGMAVRNTLTDEWDNRGVRDGVGYAILTNEIMNGAFEMSVEKYKSFKGLARENLRDHMNDLELILTMLAEATTTKFTRGRDSRHFPALKKDAREGGEVAGQTRENIEQRSNKKVISPSNFKNIGQLK